MTLESALSEQLRVVVREEVEAALDRRRPEAVLAQLAHPPSELLNVPQLLKLLPGVSSTSVCRWIRSGKLEGRRLGRGYVVTREAFERFLKTPSVPLRVYVGEPPSPQAEAARLLRKVRGVG